MNEIPVDDAFLQVNDDQRGVGVKNSKRHRVLLLGYKVDMGKKQDAVGSIVNKPRKQFECRLKLLLLVNRKLLRDGRCEPVLSRGPALLKPLQAFGGERHQSLPPVARGQENRVPLALVGKVYCKVDGDIYEFRRR